MAKILSCKLRPNRCR